MPPSRRAESPDSMARLGGRVAGARREAGLTLAQVAARNGVSPAYISQIESGAANPTVRALDQVAQALGTDVAALFGTAEHNAAPADLRFAPYRAPAPLAARAEGQAGVWEQTAAGARQLSARLIHATAADHAELVAHQGEEFVVVLRGHCRVHVDGEVWAMAEGDACHFDARCLHRISDVSPDLTFSVVMSGPTAR